MIELVFKTKYGQRIEKGRQEVLMQIAIDALLRNSCDLLVKGRIK